MATTSRHRLVRIAAVSVALLLSSAAAGADAPPPSAGATDAQARAQALLSEGNRLAGEGDFGGALERFRGAYAIYPVVGLLLNIGTSLRHIGNNAEAARTYERYLADPQHEPRRRPELLRILDEIEQVVGRVRYQVNEPGAIVRLDGKPLGSHGQHHTVRVDPGEHTLIAEKPGFVTAVRTLAVERRQLVAVKLTLAKPGAASPVVIERTDGTAQRVVGYLLGAAGLGAAVAGGIVGAVALATDADAADHCLAAQPTVCDEEGQRLGNNARDQATVSTVLLVTGGVAFTAGLVVWLTAPPDDDGEGERAEPGAVSAALQLSAAPAAAFTLRW